MVCNTKKIETSMFDVNFFQQSGVFILLFTKVHTTKKKNKNKVMPQAFMAIGKT
jgi:hypothetical protein